MGRHSLFVVAALVAAALAVPAAVAHEGEVHPPPAAPPTARVGVLLADHGEPPEYNALTYASFREFFEHLIEMGVVPAWLATLDTGTVLMDADCPACASPSAAPRLVDAWLEPHAGPALFVPASDSLPAHYVEPAGPGLREPDIFEHVGLQAYQEWRAMGGRSPNYDEKLAKKRAVIERLQAAYGDAIAIRVGYGIDPRIGGGRQGIREALDALVNRDRVTELVVAYHGVGFSDIMQTHHLRHVIGEHLEHLGVPELRVRYAKPMGATDAYLQAVAGKVGAELAAVPADAPVAIHLSGHGLATGMCGDYDCGADAYHRSSRDLFARARAAVLAHIERPGRTELFHVYGDGGDAESDPDDEVASTAEGLAARKDQGFTHVVDIPYEFDSNSRDTLIVLRRGYGRPTPDWNARWESHWVVDGVHVKIANALGFEDLKADALEAVIRDALGSSNGAAAHDH